MMGGARHALAFLTRVPIDNDNPRGMSSILAWFWLPGSVYGLIWMGARLAVPTIPANIGALVAVAGEVLLSGGLHWDGWADVFDAWGAPPDRRQAARQDARLGAMGVLVLGLGLWAVLALWQDTVARGPVLWAVLPPLLARSAMAVGLVVQPVDPDSQLANWLRSRVNPRGAWWSVAVSVASAMALTGLSGVYLILVIAVVLILFWAATRRLFGGINGDVLGASAILTEILWMAGQLGGW